MHILHSLVQEIGLIQVLRDTGIQAVTSEDVWFELGIDTILPVGTRKLRLTWFSDPVNASGGNNTDFALDWIILEHQSRIFDSTNFDDRIYEVTTAGITDNVQPTFDTGLGNTTADGTVVFTAREAWSRAVEVTAVDGTDPRRKFTVTELTPNSSGVIVGRDYFPDDAMNGGAITWESGPNQGTSSEVKDFVADDGVTITQDLELFLTLHSDVTVGDKGRIYRGCDKRRETCRDIFANAAGALACTRHGAIAAMPSRKEVRTLMADQDTK